MSVYTPLAYAGSLAASTGAAVTLNGSPLTLNGAVAFTGAKVEVKPFSNLLVHFAKEVGASVIVRGLRDVADFDYEFQMTGMNARLNPDIETVFLMASERSQFISSRFVKEIHKLGGDVSQFVSPRVVDALNRK